MANELTWRSDISLSSGGQVISFTQQLYTIKHTLYLQRIYPQLELEKESCNGEDARQVLQSAKALVEPVWKCYLSDDGRNSFEEE